MKTYSWVQLQIHILLNSASDADEWSASRSTFFTPLLLRQEIGDSHAGTNTEKKKEISVLAENRHPLLRHAFRSLVSQYLIIRLGFQVFYYHF